MALNIVLVEPRIPQNVGNIARTCAATGSRLHLVEPMAFQIDDKKLKRAGLDYWHLLDISYYIDIDDFFAKSRAPIGASDQAKRGHSEGQSPERLANDGKFFFFTTKAKKIYTDASFDDGCYLVFGREDAGLSESLLASGRGENLRLPMIDDARSLNLSNSVAVAVYEALRQNGFSGLRGSSPLGL